MASPYLVELTLTFPATMPDFAERGAGPRLSIPEAPRHSGPADARVAAGRGGNGAGGPGFHDANGRGSSRAEHPGSVASGLGGPPQRARAHGRVAFAPDGSGESGRRI